MKGADHESFKIRSPPLSQTVTNFPLIVDTMSAIELLGVGWRSKAIVEALFQTFDLVLAGF